MLTGHWTYRSVLNRTAARLLLTRLARVAAAALPLPALLAIPAHAETGQLIAICSGAGANKVYLPVGEGSPGPTKKTNSGCAHFTCPRESGDGEPSEEEEA